MRILAIDPGPKVSGTVILEDGVVHLATTMGNDEMVAALRNRPDFRDEMLVIENIASYGMAVGAEVFDTCRWIGRFQQAWHTPDDVVLVYRKDVKMHLCGTPRAKDANIRQALIDKLGPQGTKKAPGPTYGVKSHAWAALAVAVTAAETV